LLIIDQSRTNLQWSDWYNVSRRDVLRGGGKTIFRYHRTLLQALKVAYPEHPWILPPSAAPIAAPRGFWDTKKNLLIALTDAEKKLSFTQVFLLP